MSAMTVETKDDKFLITIDQDYIDKDVLIRLIDRIKLEHLIRKADFDESIEELGEEIKADWWAKNKERILGRIA